MKDTIYAYENVYNRQNPKEVTFKDFINNPEFIYMEFYKEDFEGELYKIKNISDKQERNQQKRNYLPAVDISPASILSIDIDGIFDKPELKKKVIDKLKKLPETLAIKESVSGNVVAFFRYECQSKDFKFLYYKLYLELILKLSVNIDFLPEIGRLRYVSIGETFYVNENSEVLTEIIEVDELPYITTVVNKYKARGVIYGSR